MSSVADAWDEWDGQLALQGLDPRAWSVARMLNAAEQQIYASAEDDKERAKLRTRLYAPPRALRRRARATPVQAPGAAVPEARTAGAGMRVPAASVAELLAQVQAEDARFGV